MHTSDDNSQNSDAEATPTVRVVFDGPPFAGKTTAARALSEALGGTVVTPAEDDGRTLWFDWMAYSAGHHDGQPVRVELVTVPGQQDLSDRRRHLLGWGDVVVFVANTSEAVFSDSVTSFRELRVELADRPETPVVVLANKRDLIDAVPMSEVVEQLGLTASDTLIEGIALQGGGIREAFVHAVHAALAHPARRLDATTAEALLDELQGAVGEPVAEPLAAEPAQVEPVEPVAAEHVEAEPEVTASVAAEPVAAEAVADVDQLPQGLTVELRQPQLNPAGVAEGDAIVILAEHWRVLVEVAQGTGPLPRTDDPAEAVIIAELAAWGLLVDGDTTPTHMIEADDSAPLAADEPLAAAPAVPATPMLAPALESAPPVSSIESSESTAWMANDASANATIRF